MSPEKPTPDKPAEHTPQPAQTPGSSPTPATPEPAPLSGTLTADDIREITTGGLTLGDAIRRIETPAE
jgi:hypothetical protein